jgi:hypothetical protein
MDCKKLLCKNGWLGFVLGASFLTMLTGCVGYGDGPSAGLYVAPVAVEDDYIYYPDYEMYYSSSRHQYAYRDGNNWISRPAPRGVSESVLLASPSVKMDFHDSPANHHATIARQYPKNWKPSDSGQGQKENQKDDNHNQSDQRNLRDDHGK